MSRLFCVSLILVTAVVYGCRHDASVTETEREEPAIVPAQIEAMAIRDERLAQELIHAGHGAYGRSNLEQAIELFDKGADSDPSRWDAFYLSGKLRLELGDVSGALEKLLVGHEIAPNDYDIMIELGNAYCDDGDMQNAELIWRKAQDSYPDRGLACNNLGIMHYEIGNYVDAVAAFTSGIERCSYLPLYKGRALSYMKIGMYYEAISDLEHLMDRMPDTAVFYWYRGHCRLSLGQHDLALSDAKRAFAIDPTDPDYNAFLQSCVSAADGG